MACLNGAAGSRRNRASSASRSLAYVASRRRRGLPSPRREPPAAPTAAAPLGPARTPPTTGGSGQTARATFMCSVRSAGSGNRVVPGRRRQRRRVCTAGACAAAFEVGSGSGLLRPAPLRDRVGLDTAITNPARRGKSRGGLCGPLWRTVVVRFSMRSRRRKPRCRRRGAGAGPTVTARRQLHCRRRRVRRREAPVLILERHRRSEAQAELRCRW